MSTLVAPARDPWRHIDVELPGDPVAGRLARGAIRRLADDMHPETFAKLRLLVSELVIALVTVPAPRSLRLVVDLAGDVVRAELSVARSNERPIGSRPPGGYGGFLRKRISNRHGVLARGDGVWFELTTRPRPRRRKFHMANP